MKDAEEAAKEEKVEEGEKKVEDTFDWDAPEIVEKLDKMAEQEFRRLVTGIIEPKLAEHKNNKDNIRQKCHTDDAVAGSGADGQSHMSLRINKCDQAVSQVFAGLKLRQLALRSPAFSKVFKLTMQSHMPLCMEMELWGPENGTIEFFLAPKSDQVN